MNGRYILDGKKAIECNNLITWANQFEKASRKVAYDKKNGIEVSTVFLGLDHSFGGKTPILFETMVFGGKHDQESERYATWEEAEKGHHIMCIKMGIR